MVEQALVVDPEGEPADEVGECDKDPLGAILGFAQLMPELIRTGMIGPQALAAAGTGMRGLLDPYAQYNADRFNYEQNLPFLMSDRWTGLLQGLAPQTTAPAQAKQGSGGNVGAGLAGMLAMLPSMSGGGTSGNMTNAGEAAARGLGNWSLAGGLT